MIRQIKKSSLLLFMFVLSSQALKAQDKPLTSLYELSNDMMEVVTKSEGLDEKRKFHLSPKETDLVVGVAKTDHMIGDYLADNLNLKSAGVSEEEIYQECLKKKLSEKDKDKLEKLDTAFQKRSFRVGAYAMYSSKEFDANVELDYKKSNYAGFMGEMGYKTNAPNKMAWSNVVKNAKVNESDSYEMKVKKVQDYIKSQTNLEVSGGVIASEFAKLEIVGQPTKWEETLKNASQFMNFDQKMNLVATMGEKMGNDYNYARADSGPESEGHVEIEKLLTNLSNNKSGGVCRDISVAQTQMLKAMGVKDAYSVAYLSNRGGHATVIARDPNDSSRLMKLNYGELYKDDAKKGTAALDQDSSLPSVGMQYRIYDAEGKPVASVPSELTQVLRDTIGKGNPFAPKSHTLYKAEFGTDGVKGSLFSGKTSMGEDVKGFALYGNVEGGGFHAKTGAALFNSKAEKTHYDLETNGVYLFGDLGYQHKIFSTKKMTASGGFGSEMEMMFLKTDSTEKGKTTSESSDMMADSNIKPYVESKIDYSLSSSSNVQFGAKVSGRIDKGNVADEGSYGLHYDSTLFTSKYFHSVGKDMGLAVEAGVNLSKYGESVAMTSSLVDGRTKYFVGGGMPISNAPGFFEDQQKFVKAGASTETKNGWNLSLEYEKNFASDNDYVGVKVMKKF